MIFPVLAVLLLCISSSVAQTETDSRIFFGKEGTRSRFPYQVYLHINNAFMCGGTIIDSTHILSAAHCFEKGASSIQVLIADNIRTRSNVKYDQRARRVQLHPQYVRGARRSEFDIAMVFLSTPIDLNAHPSTVAALPLATGQSDLPQERNGDFATVSGYGQTDRGDTSPTIRYTTQKVRDCPPSSHDRNSVCTYGENTNRRASSACYGDSGGPLAFKGKLVGVVSGGENCRGTTSFSSVVRNLDWIRSEMGGSLPGGVRQPVRQPVSQPQPIRQPVRQPVQPREPVRINPDPVRILEAPPTSGTVCAQGSVGVFTKKSMKKRKGTMSSGPMEILSVKDKALKIRICSNGETGYVARNSVVRCHTPCVRNSIVQNNRPRPTGQHVIPHPSQTGTAPAERKAPRITYEGRRMIVDWDPYYGRGPRPDFLRGRQIISEEQRGARWTRTIVWN